jgi:hypothetical protein
MNWQTVILAIFKECRKLIFQFLGEENTRSGGGNQHGI